MTKNFSEQSVSMGAGVQRRTFTRLDTLDEPSGNDPRFTMPAHMDPRLRKPGKKTVALGVGLTFVGCVLLGCYLLWYFGFMPIPDDEERGTSLALLVLGELHLRRVYTSRRYSRRCGGGYRGSRTR